MWTPMLKLAAGQLAVVAGLLAVVDAALWLVAPISFTQQQVRFAQDLPGLKRQITAEVQKVVQGLEKDVAAVALKVDVVNRQLAVLKTKVVDQSGNEANLKSLDSIAKSKRVELERLQKQLEDNRTVVNTRQVPVEAQLISRARPNSTSAAVAAGAWSPNSSGNSPFGITRVEHAGVPTWDR